MSKREQSVLEAWVKAKNFSCTEGRKLAELCKQRGLQITNKALDTLALSYAGCDTASY